MKKKLSRIATVLALAATALLGTTPADAYQGAISTYVSTDSAWQIGVHQSYNNEYVVVQKGHWNFEYGNTANDQTVTGIYNGPNSCVRVYKQGAPGTWVPWIWYANYSDTTGRWASTSGWTAQGSIFLLVGFNKYTNSGGC